MKSKDRLTSLLWQQLVITTKASEKENGMSAGKIAELCSTMCEHFKKNSSEVHTEWLSGYAIGT